MVLLEMNLGKLPFSVNKWEIIYRSMYHDFPQKRLPRERYSCFGGTDKQSRFCLLHCLSSESSRVNTPSKTLDDLKMLPKAIHCQGSNCTFNSCLNLYKF